MRGLAGFVDARTRYAQVTTPVALVYSEQDWSRPAERDQVARQLDVEAIAVPGTGHFSALERPTEMVRIIRQSAGKTASR
jgi:pimeloyl-ACP methyl ester carboxylesterase